MGNYWRYAFHCGSQTRSSFWVKPLRVIAALHKVFQCYSFTSYCFRAGEAHAQLRSGCGSYIVRARSLTKLATSAPDQECDYLAIPNGGSGLNWTGAHGASIRCSTNWATEPQLAYSSRNFNGICALPNIVSDFRSWRSRTCTMHLRHHPSSTS